MLRKLACVGLVLTFCISLALADEIRGTITKVDGDKVTFTKKAKKGEKGEEMTLTVAADVKVVKGNFNKDTKKVEAGEALSGGLKNEAFTSIGEKGVAATIITDADNKKITEIRVGGGKGKKKGA
jgi:hypothetical protein